MKRALISININTGSYNEFLATLVNLADEAKGASYVCVANVHMLVEAYRNPVFAAIVNNADIVTPDGVPLCFALKLLHGKPQERVAGMDLLPDLLKKAAENSIPVYFYGGTEEMLLKTRAHLNIHFPEVILAGMYSPPFVKNGPDAIAEDAERINKSGAKFIFVALGCPKQEKWMAAMKNRVNGSMIGIGGALPVMIGMRKRTPKWMQHYALEWLFRLYQEPRRLFKRYMVTNSIFIKLLINAWIDRGDKSANLKTKHLRKKHTSGFVTKPKKSVFGHGNRIL